MSFQRIVPNDGKSDIHAIDSDDLEEMASYLHRLYLDCEWMEDINQVHIILAPGLKMAFERPGHTLEVRVDKEILYTKQ